MAKVRDEFYVDLRGRRYPVYAGVLIAAIETGLKSLTVAHVQLPTEENGHTAVMRARAEFEDGRVFEDYGDCSPRNTSAQIATASIRMASTRAKGRVLRDGIGLGETLKEELPDDEEAPANGQASAHRPPLAAPVRQAPPAQAPPAQAPPAGGGVCQECQKPITKNEIAFSQHHVKMSLCGEHAREEIGKRTASSS